MPEPKEHARHRNWLETILRYIPGFRGYLEKEYRRDSDRLVRQWLADRLQRCKRSLDRVARTLADAGQIDTLPLVDRLRGRLDRLIGRFRGAMRGYSGVFDLVRIREDVLDKVYEHDMALIELVDAAAVAVEQLSDDQATIVTAVEAVFVQLDDLEHKWDAREDILEGLE